MNFQLKNIFLAIAVLAAPKVHAITYRLLDLTNAHEIQEVCNLFSDQEIQEATDATQDSMKSFLDLTQPGKKYDNWKVYIAQNIQGKLCGCMAYSMGDAATTGNDEAEVKLLAVTHDCRRQKVATGLVQKLQDDHPHITALKTYIGDYSHAAKANAMHFFAQSGFVEFEKNRGMRKILGVGQDQPALPTNQGNSKIEIKVVNKDDAQEIKSLADLFIDKEIQQVIDWRPESIIANAQGFDDLVYIAKAADGTVCGALMAVIDGETAATSSKMIICTVATHPQYRNQGIAMQLLQKIEAVCLSKNLQRLELWVIADNEKAVRCYQKAGFTQFANSIGLIKKIKGL
jgi:ribosomal protein S18 acetylase RimI-like enzyme